jgi:hypothetical protein
MGGHGSGRWDRPEAKATVEDCLTLSTTFLLRHKALQLGGRKGLRATWTVGLLQEPLTTIVIDTHVDLEDEAYLELHYRLNGREYRYEISLVETALPWRGSRWWFLCPLARSGNPCGRRVSKLYVPPGLRYFGCRHCYDLTYTSSQKSLNRQLDLDRLFRKLAKKARSE